ncbi:hypothetical protein A2276_05915 [candidate division WOR-1 bacterium RIFOXYA12_FULL_43_27]|uniref:O-antigen ligase-related domain-containing protein n=1 Tax=candidate division WOR-1 bacterium RIFOXYC2_FULL_46_14 TaxID=1802587 RepID=A0A1F4U3E8_UNCSA|nr:MAG: hypothetical protein A2276_05915 [candidate division WOR-1 bacterium RIFOXYA12_FULL_43_27]OGC20198.1 MAG: hypothetical protein A2292_03915 [candidate division WOR-1 bacterium RIFOXYB2_FULL_46_45]OGC32064.1 MAG: hypothetical protein A2232_07530 [candidate division WOR-1 bacterium RIFOXYA2_FULL_46_56]OGC39466.1 MAG: hypothetical protein A2438_07895 [candidate division WOR-1 bacterium RIFOXYC2_FULL_46_14]
MFVIFILSLPLLVLSIAQIGGKDILISYATTSLLILYFFLRKKNAKIYFPVQAVFFLVFFVYLLMTVGYFSFSGMINEKHISQLATYTIYFFFYVLLVNVFVLQSKKQLIRYVNLFILICVVFSLYSVLQAFLPTGSIVFKLFRNANSSFALWDPTNEGHRVGWFGLYRVTGLAAEPSMWAGFLAVPLCLLLPRLYYKFERRDFYCFFGILLGFLFTFGRTGFYSVFLAAISFPCFILKGNKRRWYVLFVVFVISSSIFYGLFADILLLGGRDWSRIERATGMIIASRMFVSNPLFGVGIGGYRNRSMEYGFEGMRLEGGGAGYPYNFYLGLAAETGIIGLALWLFFLKSFWNKLSYQISCFKENTEERILYLGLGLAFLSIVFSWINVGGINSVYIFFIFALISAMSKSVDRVPIMR